jgi:hypothetical protein
MKMGHIYSIYFEEGLKTLNFTRMKFEQVLQLCLSSAFKSLESCPLSATSSCPIVSAVR